MFFSEMSAANRAPYYRRGDWPWQTCNKYACLNCRKHIVTPGLLRCPTCGHMLAFVTDLPKKTARAWRKVRGRVINVSQEQPLHPPARARRFPSNGPPKY